MRRSAAFLALVALLAGCDLVSGDDPSTFTATYSGAASGTATGAYAYTHQFSRRGVGAREVYAINFGEAGPTEPGVSVALYADGVGEPSGTYTVGSGAAVSFVVGGLPYEARSGTFTVARRGGRFVGEFNVAEGVTLSAATGPVAMSGRFDVARTD